ncbi:MAG TPA: sortase [Candidatus Saccharimonadales bacterium]|nr:sortase [Candidatus Saccharimonadales bacterium]
MKKISSLLIISGLFFVLLGAAVLIGTFLPVIKIETKYQLEKNSNNINQEIKPIDENFGIIIPKIGANAKVIANVDPNDESKYQNALTMGVAHAKGTALPDVPEGNTFLFSHSSVNFWEATRYNSIFYLLSKLETGDEIQLFYKGQKYTYKVTDKKVVSPSEVSYLQSNGNKKTLTLMTCTPAGTTINRLIITAELL